MEIEMKYAVPDKQTLDSIWEDEYLNEISDASSAESLVMKAIYFDTADYRLSKNNIAVRVRSEGETYFATLKTNGSHKDGLFTRDEINVPITDETSFMALNPAIFKGSDPGDVMISLVGDEPLLNVLEMRFLRRRKRLAYASTIMELAVDSGSIITDKGEVPIMEIELELFAGDAEATRKLGDIIAEKYGLKVKISSKFRDGLDILGL
ncbi:MAG: CYTH domain-containing protein [Clostridia bacterium]|nr:CYTH domain-containing protein [Clostridia bacterium]